MMTTTAIAPKEIARAMQLRYIRPGQKGYQRRKKGKTFIYLDQENKQITDPEIIEHIQGLVLPPAWTEVWICPFPNGHLQATGIDARGRKQYRYHSRWSRLRNEHKFDRLLAFGKQLPRLRRQLRRDIRQKRLVREKVVAIALSIMNETYIRAGNTAYEKEYGSYGLTTLKNKHVSISGSKAFFRFKGKKGVMHQVALKDASLARLLRNVRELPGQELFQYYDEKGELRKLESGDINDYLKAHMAADFSSKDFRTWAGCVAALQLMAEVTDFSCDVGCRKNSIAIIDGVAAQLGNTRAVCRKYYIHPLLLQAYEEKKLDEVLLMLQKAKDARSLNTAAEKALLSFLKELH
ncbi:DNA topoisomerase IB [Taibaiella helva]|uniref:DNA topoisomerase IB n=1 Tax=Taibaiella helva TaxID=2301235 RepID=UPI0018E4E361|nr:DNA topoisomerase IB [Taibaiella helva]